MLWQEEVSATDALVTGRKMRTLSQDITVFATAVDLSGLFISPAYCARITSITLLC